MKIAFIDDKTENLEAWLAAMESISDPQVSLEFYLSVDEFEEALFEGYRPDIVFTDYHIDDRFGTEVVEMLRRQFGDQVYIIAHSSRQWRNEHLLQVGADEAVPKFENQNPSTTVDDRFRTFDDLVELAAMKRGNLKRDF